MRHICEWSDYWISEGDVGQVSNSCKICKYKWFLNLNSIKGNVVRTNVYHKYIKDLKLNITIDLDGFIY